MSDRRIVMRDPAGLGLLILNAAKPPLADLLAS
jgi:hypothetical protein